MSSKYLIMTSCNIQAEYVVRDPLNTWGRRFKVIARLTVILKGLFIFYLYFIKNNVLLKLSVLDLINKKKKKGKKKI
jgi:hypothetical protein